MNQRSEWAIRAALLSILAISCLLSASLLTTGHAWGDDFSQYISQAKSLSERRPAEFVERERFTVAQSSFPLGPVAYPWGFPAALAPLYAVFGLNMLALKSLNVATYLLFLAVLWFGFRTRHSGIWRLAFVSLFALNPTLLKFMDNILSDIPFLFLSTLAVVLLGMVIVEKQVLISRAWDRLLLGVVFAMAYFVRSNGILLIAALAAAQSIAAIRSARARQDAPHGGWPARLRSVFPPANRAGARDLCVNILPYASFAILVSIWNAFLPEGGSSYVAYMKAPTLQDLWTNAKYYLALPPGFFAGAPQRIILFYASIPLAIAGLLMRRRADHHIIVYAALTLLLCILWPYKDGLRFLFPVLPFYISFVLTPLEALYGAGTAWRQRAVRQSICMIPVVVLALCFAKQSAEIASENLDQHREKASGPFTASSQDMFSFVKRNTGEASAVVFFKPRVMSLMTGRPSIMIVDVKDISRGDYIVYGLRDESDGGQITLGKLQRLIVEKRVRQIYRNADYEVYRLDDGQAG